MTVIAAHRSGWMVADTRSTNGPVIGQFDTHKILHFGHTLIGVAGMRVTLTEFPKELSPRDIKTPESLKAAAQEYIRSSAGGEENSVMLLVNNLGELLYIDGLGSLCPVQGHLPYFCIGSGSPDLGGYLAATQAIKGEITAEDAVAGVRYVSTVDCGVNDIVDVAHIEKPAAKGGRARKKSQPSSRRGKASRAKPRG